MLCKEAMRLKATLKVESYFAAVSVSSSAYSLERFPPAVRLHCFPVQLRRDQMPGELAGVYPFGKCAFERTTHCVVSL